MDSGAKLDRIKSEELLRLPTLVIYEKLHSVAKLDVDYSLTAEAWYELGNRLKHLLSVTGMP